VKEAKDRRIRGTPRFWMPLTLKRKLQRQLNRPGPANLIQGIEPAIRATRPKATCQRLRRMAKQRVGQLPSGGPKLG